MSGGDQRNCAFPQARRNRMTPPPCPQGRETKDKSQPSPSNVRQVTTTAHYSPISPPSDTTPFMIPSLTPIPPATSAQPRRQFLPVAFPGMASFAAPPTYRQQELPRQIAPQILFQQHQYKPAQELSENLTLRAQQIQAMRMQSQLQQGNGLHQNPIPATPLDRELMKGKKRRGRPPRRDPSKGRRREESFVSEISRRMVEKAEESRVISETQETLPETESNETLQIVDKSSDSQSPSDNMVNDESPPNSNQPDEGLEPTTSVQRDEPPNPRAPTPETPAPENKPAAQVPESPGEPPPPLFFTDLMEEGINSERVYRILKNSQQGTEAGSDSDVGTSDQLDYSLFTFDGPNSLTFEQNTDADSDGKIPGTHQSDKRKTTSQSNQEKRQRLNLIINEILPLSQNAIPEPEPNSFEEKLEQLWGSMDLKPPPPKAQPSKYRNSETGNRSEGKVSYIVANNKLFTVRTQKVQQEDVLEKIVFDDSFITVGVRPIEGDGTLSDLKFAESVEHVHDYIEAAIVEEKEKLP